MRVVLIQSYELFPDSRLSRELDLLTAAGHEITVILWQRSVDGAYIKHYSGVAVEKIVIPALRTLGGWQHFKLQPQFHCQIYQKLKKLRPDLIIAHNLETVPPAVFYRLRFGTPVIYVAREVYTKVFHLKLKTILGEPIGWLVEAVLAHLCSAVITVTPRLVKHYRTMGVNAVWVPNAPARRFLEADTQKSLRDEITVGFIGNLRPNCGIEDMWRALRLLNNQGKTRYRLFLCGLTLGGFEKVIEQMVVEAPENIMVRSTILPEEVPALYQNIDIAFQLLHPVPGYKGYSLSVKIYEALAMETPVIICNMAEDPDFLADTGTCIIIHSHAPEEIAEAVRRLGENPELRLRMGKAGREFIKAKFNWDLFSDHYLAVVKRVTHR